jgi:phosphomannomutase/phosphoglucomutase
MAINAGIFRQYDIRGVVGDDLTTEAAEAIGRAYAAHLASRGIRGNVAVGRDNRPSGLALRDARPSACGVDVVIPASSRRSCTGACIISRSLGDQITGSHNPPEYNGFKLCVGTESLHGAGIQGLLRFIREASYPAGEGTVCHEEVIARYIDDIVAKVGPLSRPLRW